MAKKKRQWGKLIWRWFLRISLGFVAFSLFIVLLYKWVNPPGTLLQLSRKMDSDKKWTSLKKEWVPLEQISPNMQLAVICGEDQNFNTHHGFDFGAIKKAIEHNEKSKNKRGASTISQQTAKNVFCWEGRSWIRKGLEAWFTGLIELIWGKRRIMEVYLNVIETGDGVFGVQAAAKKYYGGNAKYLSVNQAAHISGLLPCPRRCGIGSWFTNARANAIAYGMRVYGIQLEYLR